MYKNFLIFLKHCLALRLDGTSLVGYSLTRIWMSLKMYSTDEKPNEKNYNKIIWLRWATEKELAGRIRPAGRSLDGPSVKQLRVRDRVMTSHNACTSGTSRVLTIASLQRLKMRGSYSSSRRQWSTVCDKVFDCTEHNADRISSSAVSAVISRSLLYQIVTEHLLFRKLCARRVPKILTSKHKTKRTELVLRIMLPFYIHLE